MGIKMPETVEILLITNKSLFVVSSWSLVTYLSKMHGHSNIKFLKQGLKFRCSFEDFVSL